MSKRKKVLVTWEEVPTGFSRYFIASIPKVRIFEVQDSKLRKHGVDAVVKEKLGVDDFKYLVVPDDNYTFEEYDSYDEEKVKPQ